MAFSSPVGAKNLQIWILRQTQSFGTGWRWSRWMDGCMLLLGCSPPPPHSSSLIFSRSGALVTATSRVERLNQGREENGRANVRVLTAAVNPGERERESWSPAEKVICCMKMNLRCPRRPSERYLFLPRRRMLAGRMNTKDTPAGNGDRRNAAQIRLAF